MEGFVEEVHRIEAAKADYVISTRHMEYKDDGSIWAAIADYQRHYEPTDHAQRQIASRLGIPAKFWNRLDEYDGLKPTVVNEMWHQRPEQRFVRTLNDDTIRAYLSDRYRPIDNMLVLDAVLPTMMEHNDLQVVSRAMGEQRMYLQVVFPRLQAEVAPGDVVQAGVTITNSEVGSGAVDIASTIWRLVCRNGMVGESYLRKNHVGSRIDLNADESYDIYGDDTIRAEIESLRLRLRDVFAASMKQSAFEHRVAALREAREDRVEDVIETAKNVTKHYGLPEDSVSAIAGNVIEERNPNRYGFANALTWYAQSLDNMDRQHDLERQGSALITMSHSAWKGLAA
jgi:hypothetical protein